MAENFQRLSRQIEKIARKLEGAAEELGKKEVKVGVLEGAYEGGTPYAYVAAIQEYGAPEVSIPPRPFIRPTIAEHRDQWGEFMADGAARVIAGEATIESVLEPLGADAAGQIQKKISEVNAPALSPITVMLRGMRANDPSLVVTGKTVGQAAARVAEGKTNYGADDKPLHDSGMLQANITHLVVSK
jgi:hypothetical protein